MTPTEYTGELDMDKNTIYKKTGNDGRVKYHSRVGWTGKKGSLSRKPIVPLHNVHKLLT